jgi:hypothetical protein
MDRYLTLAVRRRARNARPAAPGNLLPAPRRAEVSLARRGGQAPEHPRGLAVGHERLQADAQQADVRRVPRAVEEAASGGVPQLADRVVRQLLRHHLVDDVAGGPVRVEVRGRHRDLIAEQPAQVRAAVGVVRHAVPRPVACEQHALE